MDETSMTSNSETILSPDASKQWLKLHNYDEPYTAGFECVVDFATPRDSGVKCGVIKSILTWLPADGDGLLYATTWGVWPSCENEELFHRMRDSLGIPRHRLIDAPGQLLDLSDRPLLECMLDICLYNFWDVLLADHKNRFFLAFSHDEFMTIACSKMLETDAQRTVDSLSIKGGKRCQEE